MKLVAYLFPLSIPVRWYLVHILGFHPFLLSRPFAPLTLSLNTHSLQPTTAVSVCKLFFFASTALHANALMECDLLPSGESGSTALGIDLEDPVLTHGPAAAAAVAFSAAGEPANVHHCNKIYVLSLA